MKLLNIEVSPNGENSSSRQASRHLLEKFKKDIPGISITTRDLDAQPIPHLSRADIGAAFTPAEARTPEQQQVIKFSDQLVDELLASDVIIISTPVWNFGLPSVLKAGLTKSFESAAPSPFPLKDLKAWSPQRKSTWSCLAAAFFPKAPMP